MDKLVTCPKCGGTGEIKLPEPEKPDKSMIQNNLDSFAEIFGVQEKPKQVSRICPDCRGLGMVRG